MSEGGNAASNQAPETHDKLLFWACFIALVATAFGFIIRALIMDEWGRQFGLTETQKGEIFGVGLWPFAVSIVLFSLIVDKIGYGKAMVFAFVAHVASAIITIATPLIATADSGNVDTQTAYWMLYLGNFIVALGNGTVEAVINPVVATMFAREKTKWLNILHAGWPGGLVFGGLLTLAMAETGVVGQLVGQSIGWQWKVALIFIPVVFYGLMMLPCRFPVSERVAAGVPYRVMLQEVGILGCLVVTTLIVFEVARVLTGMDVLFSDDAFVLAGASDPLQLRVKLGLIALITGIYGAYTRALGRPMFVFLLLIMIPLATTELGTDSWITELLEPEMQQLGLQAGWVLVYTSLIMMILRFFAGPIVHKLSPLGLLAISAFIAALGLVSLSKATGLSILVAATLYGFGKTFFWPTMLGVVAERFPRGGALTLNTMGGVGMLGVGVVGAALLGNIQDKEVDQQLAQKHPELHVQVVGEEQISVFGTYKPVDPDRVDLAAQEDQFKVEAIRKVAKKNALMTVAIFPIIMLVCYLGLILYFRAQGGYKAEVLEGHAAEDEEFTGGIEAPMEA